MDGWVDYLHFSFLGEHVLFSSLRLNTFSGFVLSSVLTAMICLCERFLTALSIKGFRPRRASRSRFISACWATTLYGFVTLLRLLYMLLAMSYHIGMIAVVVISLSMGQFIVEYYNHPRPMESESERCVQEPLLDFATRRRKIRTKSRPDSIFIHPTHSNLARADAAALELGIAGDTELVKGNRPLDYQAWEHGKGKDVARQLFGGMPRQSLDTGEGEDGSP